MSGEVQKLRRCRCEGVIDEVEKEMYSLGGGGEVCFGLSERR